jgi:hypothetical protein
MRTLVRRDRRVNQSRTATIMNDQQLSRVMFHVSG